MINAMRKNKAVRLGGKHGDCWLDGQGRPSSLEQRADEVKQFGNPEKKQPRKRKERLWQGTSLGYLNNGQKGAMWQQSEQSRQGSQGGLIFRTSGSIGHIVGF